METKRIKIVVTERKTAEGRVFPTFHTFSKNGRRTDVKFRKEVTAPTANCYIECDVADMNLNTSGQFPVLWIKAIQRVISAEEVNGENAAANAAKINDYFG